MDSANTGYVLKPVFEWLSVPDDLASAVMATVGCQLGDHVSAIAFVPMVKAPPAPVTPMAPPSSGQAPDPANAALTVIIDDVIAQGLNIIDVIAQGLELPDQLVMDFAILVT